MDIAKVFDVCSNCFGVKSGTVNMCLCDIERVKKELCEIKWAYEYEWDVLTEEWNEKRDKIVEKWM